MTAELWLQTHQRHGKASVRGGATRNAWTQRQTNIGLSQPCRPPVRPVDDQHMPFGPSLHSVQRGPSKSSSAVAGVAGWTTVITAVVTRIRLHLLPKNSASRRFHPRTSSQLGAIGDGWTSAPGDDRRAMPSMPSQARTSQIPPSRLCRAKMVGDATARYHTPFASHGLWFSAAAWTSVPLNPKASLADRACTVRVIADAR